MSLPARRSAMPASPPAPAPFLSRVWDPFTELQEIQSHARELMERAWPGFAAGAGDVWAPPVDIEETDDAWIVEAELPGVERNDVDIEVRDSEVRISGELKERERQGILRRRARRVGRFEFRVALPGDTDADNVDASMKNGVLTVRIPKAETSEPHRIEVRDES
jgi:HSP20 family protein